MNLFKTIKQTVYSACLYFTVSEFLLLLISTAIMESTPESGGFAAKFLSLTSTAWLFLACLIVALMNLVWKLEYSGAVKMLIHFAGTFAAYALIFIVVPGVYNNVTQIIVRSVIFAAVYAIIALICLLISGIKKTRRSEDLEYESKFGSYKDR